MPSFCQKNNPLSLRINYHKVIKSFLSQPIRKESQSQYSQSEGKLFNLKKRKPGT